MVDFVSAGIRGAWEGMRIELGLKTLKLGAATAIISPAFSFA